MQTPEIESQTRKRFPQLRDGALEITEIDRTGSGRIFVRFATEDQSASIMAMHYSLERAENAAFAPITRFLESRGVAVPAIEDESVEEQLLWITDLGRDDLWAYRDQDWPTVRRPLYQATLKAVSVLHQITEDDAESVRLPELQPCFDDALYQWEQDYFFDHFAANFSTLDAAGIAAVRAAPSLDDLKIALCSRTRRLIHRDLQSQNVMIRDGRPYLIDYQGMRFGLPEYDLASLFYDPYLELSETERDELARFYHETATDQDEPYEAFRERLDRCTCQRLMQALGAYGFLSLVKNQRDYLDFIPTAVARLRSVAVDRGVLPILDEVLQVRD